MTENYEKLDRQINVRLDDGMHRWVVREARLRRTSQSSLIREAIIEYLKERREASDDKRR